MSFFVTQLPLDRFIHLFVSFQMYKLWIRCKPSACRWAHPSLSSSCVLTYIYSYLENVIKIWTFIFFQSFSSTRCSCSSRSARPVSRFPIDKKHVSMWASCQQVYFYFHLLSRYAVIATVALAFLLLPMCQYLSRPCTSGTKYVVACLSRRWKTAVLT